MKTIARWLTVLFLPVALVHQAHAAEVGREPARAQSVGGLLRRLREGGPDERQESLTILRSRGTEVIGELGRALSGPHAVEAACVLGRMGKPAAAALIQGLRNEDPMAREFAARGLWLIGEDALPSLREALRDKQACVRAAAASALGEMGETAVGTVPDLVRALADEDADVRVRALSALARLEGPPALMPHLLQSLRDKDARVRGAACCGLVDVGAPAIPALAAALGDTQASVREIAAEALGTIGRQAEAIAAGLPRALEDENPKVRAAAAFALVTVGVPLKKAVPILGDVLRRDDTGPDDRDAMDAAHALSHMGAPAIPELLKVLADRTQSKHVRVCASLALARLGSAAVNELIGPLGDEEADVRQYAAEALGCMGPAAMGAAYELELALADESAEVRMHAATALGNIGLPATAVVSGLIRRLKEDQVPRVREAAALALGQIALEDPDDVHVLVQAISDEDANVRCAVAFALGMARGPTERRVATLIAVLREGSASVRASAAQALGYIGKGAETAIPALEAACSEARAVSDPRVSWAAAEAIESIRGETTARVPDLLWALGHIMPDPAEAVDTLGRAGAKGVPQLVHLLRHGGTRFRRAAAMTVMRIGPAAWRAAPVLADILNEAGHGLARRPAVIALGEIGVPARLATLDLVRNLRYGGSSDTGDVPGSLARIWRGDRHVLRAILGALKHPDVQVRRRAAVALRDFPVEADEVVPALRAALNDEPFRDWFDSTVIFRWRNPRVDGIGLADMIRRSREYYLDAVAEALAGR